MEGFPHRVVLSGCMVPSEKQPANLSALHFAALGSFTKEGLKELGMVEKHCLGHISLESVAARNR